MTSANYFIYFFFVPIIRILLFLTHAGALMSLKAFRFEIMMFYWPRPDQESHAVARASQLRLKFNTTRAAGQNWCFTSTFVKSFNWIHCCFHTSCHFRRSCRRPKYTAVRMHAWFSSEGIFIYFLSMNKKIGTLYSKL